MPEPVQPTLTPDQAAGRLRELADRWQGSTLGERSAFQSWFNEFCDALGVARPGPDHGEDYCFEKPVIRPLERGDAQGWIDCWKAGHFAVEAKGSGNAGSNEPLLRRAFKQLSDYVSAEPGTVPPFLMVVDVPRELILWSGWRGFGGFAAGTRILLDALPDSPEQIALLQDVFARPHVRDPRGKAQQVTRDIAGKLAELAAAFEDRGHESERVARFLMRCVFCFFAEDVGLLPKQLFKRTLENARSAGGQERVAAVLTSLWRTMDTGGDFGADLIQRFNGHFFQTVESLPLEPADIDLLIEAAGFDWSGVEPSIFGTLLVRALEPAERHKLGAEYTPREYIERLVEPTVVEPIRERWNAVQARVVQLEADDATKAAVGATHRVAHAGRSQKPSKARREAVTEVLSFHAWLRGLRFLDPACGSGNFLYVTMAAVKRIELEVFRELERLQGASGRTHQTESMVEEVHPRQFFGIEVNWWAREIAELTLWIGYHQFWRETHGGRTPPVPILEDTGTIECRDAILAWDAIVHRPEKDRPDPTPRIVHPVTGELVPDPEAKLPYYEYVGARPAEWPEADFIVGNPPYIGAARQEEALGKGYVDAMRSAYDKVAASTDLVGYWWHKASIQVGRDATTRAGLITTSSITQPLNRRVIADGISIGSVPVWAAPDHPWVEESDGAAVRVSLTVLARSAPIIRRAWVDQQSGTLHVIRVARLNADLTSHVDILGAARSALQANDGLAFVGVEPNGKGFVLSEHQAATLLAADQRLTSIIRPYLNGRDLADRSRNAWIIDFADRSLEEAQGFPGVLQILIDRVKPARMANKDLRRRTFWWQFGRDNQELREAVATLKRFIVTVKTSRWRFFTFVSTAVPDSKLNCIASDDADVLGVLSSQLHLTWSLAAGGRLGVGNDPTYNKDSSFDPFPFPDPPGELRERIAAVAERLDQHRKDAIARDERVTMTGMYNVVAKLRSGEALTPKERAIHEVAACGVLRDLHNELDGLVAEAYGWPWPMDREEILERLVALHDERVAEEATGQVRWLRPEYQMPRFAREGVVADLGLETPDAPGPAAGEATARVPWPKTAVEQIALVQGLVGRGVSGVSALVDAFEGVDRKLVARHLETLEILGEV